MQRGLQKLLTFSKFLQICTFCSDLSEKREKIRDSQVSKWKRAIERSERTGPSLQTATARIKHSQPRYAEICGDSGKGEETVSHNIKSAIKSKTFPETLMFQRVQVSAHANVTWWKRKGWKLKSGLIKFWRQRSPSPTLWKGSAFTFCKTWLHIHSASCKIPSLQVCRLNFNITNPNFILVMSKVRHWKL